MKITLEIEQGSGIQSTDDPAQVIKVLNGEVRSANVDEVTARVEGSGPPPNALGIDQAIHYVLENPELSKAFLDFSTRFLSIAYSMWRDYWPGSKVTIKVGDKAFQLTANHTEWASLESELARLRSTLPPQEIVK